MIYQLCEFLLTGNKTALNSLKLSFSYSKKDSNSGTTKFGHTDILILLIYFIVFSRINFFLLVIFSIKFTKSEFVNGQEDFGNIICYPTFEKGYYIFVFFRHFVIRRYHNLNPIFPLFEQEMRCFRVSGNIFSTRKGNFLNVR